MSGQGKQFEDLCSWVTDLTSLQNICIKKSLGTVQGMSLNAFAQAKVIGTVGGGNLYNFGIYVHQQFPQYNPQDGNETPGDQTTFRDLTDLLAGARVRLGDSRGPGHRPAPSHSAHATLQPRVLVERVHVIGRDIEP